MIKQGAMVETDAFQSEHDCNYLLQEVSLKSGTPNRSNIMGLRGVHNRKENHITNVQPRNQENSGS